MSSASDIFGTFIVSYYDDGRLLGGSARSRALVIEVLFIVLPSS